ncbi:hypothetical protein [Microbacterium sp. NPDC089696]|uniref:DUF6414 family protein n=1 Tax=Microbacterium sp. NPDC089696 TaxID=3364199 RepID=UPI00381301A8
MSKKSAQVESGQTPSATIYQNSDQVAGVLQQLFTQPLIVDETREVTAGAEDEKAVTANASAGGEGGFDVPLLGALKVKGAGGVAGSGSWTSNTGTASRQQYVYSQAYYLHLVRQQLAQDGNVRSVRHDDDLDGIAPGTFVEYTTSFDPVEVALALEVITPDLVDAITQWTVRKQYTSAFPEDGGFEAVRVHAEKMKVDAESKGQFARAVAAAVQADARQESTREYYGRISQDPAITAITVCEREHFITADPDRLLDGTFTVFGKVISAPETDVSTFARNKLLRNLSADAFDYVIDQMQSALRKGTPVAGIAMEDFIDLKLDSRVRGQSFRVLPLAIFS